MPRRIRRNREQENIYKALTEGETAVFETYKDVFMMAACVGFSMRSRVSFERSAEPIAMSVFSGNNDLPIINAIAFQETGDVGVLLGDEEAFDKKLTIVEEYANGGLDLLRHKVLEIAGDPLDNLISFLLEQSPDEIRGSDVSLTSVVDSLFSKEQ